MAGNPDAIESQTTPTDFFNSYSEYNKTLRTWFVTFGLGGPVLFMLHPDLSAILKADKTLDRVVYLFLVGCFLQVLIALINKFVSWKHYQCSTEEKELNRFIAWLNESFWLDTAFDWITAASFAWALQTILTAFLVNSNMPTATSASVYTHPTITEAFDLRSRCADLGRKILNDNLIGPALAHEQTSHYVVSTNRCYVQIDVHSADLSESPPVDNHYLYDGQTAEMLVFATNTKGNKIGWGGDLKQGASPYDQALEKMHEIMVDDRKS